MIRVARGRRREAGPLLMWLLVVSAGVAAGAVDVAVMTAGWLRGSGWQWRHPANVVIGLATGELSWSVAATGVLVAEVVLAVALPLVVVGLLRRRLVALVQALRPRRLPPTRVEPVPSSDGPTTRTRASNDVTGVLCGRGAWSGQPVYAPWDRLHLDVWGPGRGKTAARVVPAVLGAPGAVVVTGSSTRVLEATRPVRNRAGHSWVFDPQGLAGEPPSWWWNPLRSVDTLAKADELADLLADARLERCHTTQEDAFFELKARRLLGLALYAAAVAERPLSDIYLWLTDPRDRTMEEILEGRSGDAVDAALGAIRELPGTTRGGVYANAELYVDWLVDDDVVQWVRSRSPSHQELEPEALVRGRDTLYLLSRGGRPSATPLTTAFTSAVLRAAERHADELPGGRLQPPMTMVLDDVASICRWRALPEVYRNAQSRGIVVMTFLQSWAEGAQLWGSEGARVLWNSATCRVYGGGNSETDFLGLLSAMTGAAGAAASGSLGRQGDAAPEMSVADLAALPEGQLVALLVGRPPLVLTAADAVGDADVPAVERSLPVVGRGGSNVGAGSGSVFDWLRNQDG